MKMTYIGKLFNKALAFFGRKQSGASLQPKEPTSAAKPEEMQANPGRGLASRRRAANKLTRGYHNGRQHIHAGGPYKGQWH